MWGATATAPAASTIDLAQDRALVEAWQAGDTAAFDELYRRHFDRLTRFCQKRVGDRAVAEEIAQDAFVRAIEALPRFDGERRFYPWMTVIAGRLCIDHHRRNGRVQASDEVEAGTVDDGHDERLTLQVDLEHLDRALRRLTERHAHVLELRERQGLSYDDIATALDVPHSTVETLLFRARKALRREFNLVSAERLAGIPVVGWAFTRASRLSARLSGSGQDIGFLSAPLAAGAMAAIIMVTPGAHATQTVVTSGTAPQRAVATAAPEAPPADLTAPAVAGHTDAGSTATPTAPSAAPGITVMPGDEAHREAAAMPLNLDLEQAGLGVDLAPIVTTVTSPWRSAP